MTWVFLLFMQHLQKYFNGWSPSAISILQSSTEKPVSGMTKDAAETFAYKVAFNN